jgi:antibiotic biosynthesis monooxygenase (ABM) superfamily enzyme
MDGRSAERAGKEPVKIVLERRLLPGVKERFEDTVRALLSLSGREFRLVGSSVLAAGEGDQYFILLRFEHPGELERWQRHPEVAEHLRHLDGLSTPAQEPTVKSGLETWFTLPGLSAPPEAPPKWKMALTTWLALYPMALLLSFALPKGLPVLLAVAVSTALPVAALTWWVMPQLTRLLYRWLYKPVARGTKPGSAARGPAVARTA